MRFSYPSGSRPLEGYTIKRGIGVGGFGEVYFALNDAGKEVALKKIQRNLDIELRGVRHCLNLKHVNLISLWDIRSNEQGESWVVMEYVPGPSLRDVVEAHPQGMPESQIKRWFASTSSGVAYLHEHGIVHRDLKPGNIFLDQDEQVIKIGDYGLSKFISHSRRSRQTESVGTFHYMAPEIGKGEYGKEIDIYAMGIMLFEMLTGDPPFDGESTQEIIMKHLTMDVDVSSVPQAYRRVISKALRKDPQKRYKGISNMVRDLPWPEIAAKPENIIGRHAVGPIRIGDLPETHSISTANHPGSPPIDPEAPTDPFIDAEIISKLPPLVIDGRDIEIVRQNEGIEFGPVQDSNHIRREALRRSERERLSDRELRGTQRKPNHETDIHYIDDRSPKNAAKETSQVDEAQGSTFVGNEPGTLIDNTSVAQPSKATEKPNAVVPSTTDKPTFDSITAHQIASNAAEALVADKDATATMVNANSAVSLSHTTTSNAPTSPDEPIAVAVKSGFADVNRWWNNANVSAPVRLGLLFVLGVVVIQNSLWLLPVVVGLATVYLIYYAARKYLLKPSLADGQTSEADLRRQHDSVVRQWLASRPTTDRMTELVGSMLIGAVAAVALSLLGLALSGFQDSSMEMWSVFTWQTLVSVAAVWTVLAVTKNWSLRRGDFWLRTSIIVFAGALIGTVAFFSASSFEIDLARVTTEDFAARQTSSWALNLMPKFPAMVVVFAALFGLARFGGHTDRLRRTRLSVMNVVACLVVAAVLSHLLNVPLTVMCILATVISVTVQLASPWMHPDEQLEVCRSQE